MKKELEELLPFWKEIDAQERELLVSNSFETTYPKGLLMHRTQQECSGIMLILEGQLRTYIMSEEGREVTLFRVYQKDVCVLSASGLMDAIVFDVLMDAVEDTKVIMIPAQILSMLMDKHPRMEAYLYKKATERFADVLWIMQQILFLSADRRVAIFLWDEMTRTKKSTISLTHDEIARYIGSAREVVTKVLKYFAQEGIVKLERGKIQITDKKLLQKCL